MVVTLPRFSQGRQVPDKLEADTPDLPSPGLPQRQTSEDSTPTSTKGNRNDKHTPYDQ
jgi:hypothetical protein